jgi:hypothetical protein
VSTFPGEAHAASNRNAAVIDLMDLIFFSEKIQLPKLFVFFDIPAKKAEFSQSGQGINE